MRKPRITWKRLASPGRICAQACSCKTFSAPPRRSLARAAFYAPLGDARLALVDVRDIAAVAVKTLTDRGHEGKAYTITGPEALTYSEVAGKLTAALGKPVRYVDVPPEQFKQSLLGAGMPDWSADALLEIFEHVVKPLGAEVTNVIAEIAKKEPITFDQFARDHAAEFGSHQ